MTYEESKHSKIMKKEFGVESYAEIIKHFFLDQLNIVGLSIKDYIWLDTTYELSCTLKEFLIMDESPIP